MTAPKMGARGVTRMGASGSPYSEARYERLAEHHRRTLWIPWTLVLLGIWTALAPFAFGYLNESLWVDPAGGRGVWFVDLTVPAFRAWLMTLSDLSSGILLVVLGWRSLLPDRPVSRWLACGVGAWMSLAPVLFWAPTASAYLNDTLVGMLVIALTILIPGMPNMTLYMRMGGDSPPGWSYNPSSWAQRWILIVTALIGFLASRHLALYQLGYLPTIGDPIFGEGTRTVLESSMSQGLPISDAGLGTLAYTFELLMAFMGSSSRWRTMPWMVALFGVLVIPLGLVHIFLVVSQPVVVGSWCTLCLVAAAAMLPMIPLEVDEVIAMLQHVVGAKRRGENVASVFFKGGDPAGAEDDERTPPLVELPRRPLEVVKASVWGFGLTLPLVVATVLGCVAMALPGLLGTVAPAADVFYLGGALIVVISVLAMGEVLRAARFLNLPVGLAVATLPLVLDGAVITAQVAGLGIGLMVMALSVPRGPIRERYGSWDRFVA